MFHEMLGSYSAMSYDVFCNVLMIYNIMFYDVLCDVHVVYIRCSIFLVLFTCHVCDVL